MDLTINYSLKDSKADVSMDPECFMVSIDGISRELIEYKTGKYEAGAHQGTVRRRRKVVVYDKEDIGPTPFCVTQKPMVACNECRVDTKEGMIASDGEFQKNVTDGRCKTVAMSPRKAGTVSQPPVKKFPVQWYCFFSGANAPNSDVMKPIKTIRKQNPVIEGHQCYKK